MAHLHISWIMDRTSSVLGRFRGRKRRGGELSKGFFLSFPGTLILSSVSLAPSRPLRTLDSRRRRIFLRRPSRPFAQTPASLGPPRLPLFHPPPFARGPSLIVTEGEEDGNGCAKPSPHHRYVLPFKEIDKPPTDTACHPPSTPFLVCLVRRGTAGLGNLVPDRAPVAERDGHPKPTRSGTEPVVRPVGTAIGVEKRMGSARGEPPLLAPLRILRMPRIKTTTQPVKATRRRLCIKPTEPLTPPHVLASAYVPVRS